MIFAILVASVGLNVNSTAVIIGAMLILPLMGPIVGIGYEAATVEPGLIRREAKSLFTAMLLSLAVSALYFRLTPLTDAGSELLGRTHPAAWNGLIALFSGAAGAVGLTRREHSNVIRAWPLPRRSCRRCAPPATGWPPRTGTTLAGLCNCFRLTACLSA